MSLRKQDINFPLASLMMEKRFYYAYTYAYIYTQF
jgi:hypothetical protein